ncbi:hypothetical protein [Sphingomonas paeninsulae]|nr:hypothetical protein [Sphingomonas paeninsulae]
MAMKHIAPLAALLLIAACAKPAPENVAVGNVADPDITEVADDSGGGRGQLPLLTGTANGSE